MGPIALGLAGNVLGGAANYALSNMFKPKGINIGQLQNTLAPQLQAGQFQQQFGQSMMDPRGAYQHGVQNQLQTQNRNNMFAQMLANRRSLGQFGGGPMSGKVNEELYRNMDQQLRNEKLILNKENEEIRHRQLRKV